jgi:hypothetical protein
MMMGGGLRASLNMVAKRKIPTLAENTSLPAYISQFPGEYYLKKTKCLMFVYV